MLSINVFRGASEQHCFKIGVWRAISIQETRHLDSIVARALLVAEFIDSIDPRTFGEPTPRWASGPSPSNARLEAVCKRLRLLARRDSSLGCGPKRRVAGWPGSRRRPSVTRAT